MTSDKPTCAVLLSCPPSYPPTCSDSPTKTDTIVLTQQFLQTHDSKTSHPRFRRSFIELLYLLSCTTRVLHRPAPNNIVDTALRSNTHMYQRSLLLQPFRRHLTHLSCPSSCPTRVLPRPTPRTHLKRDTSFRHRSGMEVCFCHGSGGLLP